MKKIKKQTYLRITALLIMLFNVLTIFSPIVMAADMPSPSASGASANVDPSSGDVSSNKQGEAEGYVDGLPAGQQRGNPNTTPSEPTVGSLGTSGSRKVDGPQVVVSFSQDGPLKQGTNITANAIPKKFVDTDNKLYYTWYIKHNGCDLDDSPNAGKISKCDLDGDNKITVNDWKIEAARIIVAGTYYNNDPHVYDGYPTPNSNMDIKSGAEAFPSVTDSNNGWITNFKRNNQGDLATKNGSDTGIPNCYVQEASTGIIFELRGKTDDSKFEPCPNGFHRACVDYKQQTCQTANSAYSQDAATQNQHDITYAQTHSGSAGPCDVPSSTNCSTDARRQNDTDNNFAMANPGSPIPKYNVPENVAWDSEVCSVTVDNNGDVQEAQNTICQGGNVSNGQCEMPGKLVPNPDGPGQMSCGIKSHDDVNNYSGQAKCDNGQPVCIADSSFVDQHMDVSPSNGGTPYGRIWDPICTKKHADEIGVGGINGDNTGNVISNVWTRGFSAEPWKSNGKTTNTTIVDETCNVLVGDIINGVKDEFGTVINYPNPNMMPTCTKGDSSGIDNTCKHLFPYFPEKHVNGIDLTNAILGDGKFTKEEKEFWKADPTKSSTAGMVVDEAAAMGLGINKFSWTYAEGDQIGVAVEGDTSLSSDHIDSSKRRMWAFSKDKCDDLTELPLTDTSYYIETINSNNVGIKTAKFDVNNCLKDNLIDPLVNPQFSMDVKLSSSSEQPKNDSNGQGDSVIVSAAVSNSANAQNLFYDWRVEKSLDGSSAPTNSTDWKDITLNMQNSYNSFSASQQQGLGNKSFKFNLNLPTEFVNESMKQSIDKGYFYLRIRARVSEKEGQYSQNAEGVITLKVYQQKNEVLVYSVVADQSGMLSPNLNDLICNDEQGKKICYVTENEILALKVPNVSQNDQLNSFSWAVNGKNSTCESKFSTNCSVGGNLLFLPAVGNVGTKINVQASAINSRTNDHIIVNRTFQIVSPQVMIVSSDTTIAWPRIKGYFKNLDGTSTPDTSTTSFQARAGNDITFRAVFYPSWKENQADYDWTVDGNAFGDHNQKEILIPATKDVGENYNIAISASYKPGANDQINNLRKALNKNWGITSADSAEQTDQKSIQVDVVENDAVVAEKTAFPWAANLLSHVPEQILFSIRIILTAMLLLFVTGVVFSLIPEELETKQ